MNWEAFRGPSLKVAAAAYLKINCQDGVSQYQHEILNELRAELDRSLNILVRTILVASLPYIGGQYRWAGRN